MFAYGRTQFFYVGIPAIRLPDTFTYSVDNIEWNCMNNEKGLWTKC